MGVTLRAILFSHCSFRSGERGAQGRPLGFCGSGVEHILVTFPHKELGAVGSRTLSPAPSLHQVAQAWSSPPRGEPDFGFSLMCTCFPDTGPSSATVSVSPPSGPAAPLPGERARSLAVAGWWGHLGPPLPCVGGGHSQLPVTSSKGIFLQNTHFIMVTLASFISSSTVSLFLNLS